ncbi:MAG: DNA-processing protein DprA [Burkholderiales bacterium]
MTIHADDPLFLRLAFTRGVSTRVAHKLLSELGDINTLFAASTSTIAGIAGDAVARALTTAPDGTAASLIDAALAWLNEAEDQHLLTWAHPAFPALLLESGDAPVILFAKGRLDLLERPALAMVGSRNCSQGGTDTAEAFAEAFSASGVTVVSGLAQGIDAAAHAGALRAAAKQPATAGSTIAVVGTGIDRVYPAKNKVLAHSIAERGLILSEYPLGTPPLAENFPRRNRIISGLARGVLVVEASMASGSLITARLAGEQGREVFAIPGSIHSTFHKGCHHLIKQGAKLVETAQDVIEELQLGAASSAAAGQSAATVNEATGMSPLLEYIEHTPIDVDALVARSSLPIDQVVTELTLLELAGNVESLPGGLWQRRAKRERA